MILNIDSKFYYLLAYFNKFKKNGVTRILETYLPSKIFKL